MFFWMIHMVYLMMKCYDLTCSLFFNILDSMIVLFPDLSILKLIIVLFLGFSILKSILVFFSNRCHNLAGNFLSSNLDLIMMLFSSLNILDLIIILFLSLSILESITILLLGLNILESILIPSLSI